MSTRKLSERRPGSVTVRMKFMFTCRRFGPLTPSIRNGKTRFWKLAGTFAGSRSNPASTLNQRSSVGSSLGMSSKSP